MKLKTISEVINEAMDPGYKKWRKDNVSFRGSRHDSPLDDINEYDGVMGKGLYTTPSSNKSMSKQYGQMWIMIGAVPQKPLVVKSMNEWEMWLQKLMMKVTGSDFPDNRAFYKKTNIETEVQKLGYDGVIIQGREMVLYNPDGKDVRFFKTEREVQEWYEDHKDE